MLCLYIDIDYVIICTVRPVLHASLRKSTDPPKTILFFTVCILPTLLVFVKTKCIYFPAKTSIHSLIYYVTIVMKTNKVLSTIVQLPYILFCRFSSHDSQEGTVCQCSGQRNFFLSCSHPKEQICSLVLAMKHTCLSF